MGKKWFVSRKRITAFIIFLYISLCLVGCGSPAAPIEPSLTAVANTPTSTIMLTETAPPTNTPLPTTTSTPTWSPEEIPTQITELLETNGGCEFPCWLGLVPGETSFDDARLYVNELSEISGFWETEESEYLSSGTWMSDENLLVFSTLIGVPEPFSLQGEIAYHAIGENSFGGLLKAQSVFGYTYTMTEVLEMLGEPSDIQFTTPIIFPSNTIPIDLFLFYPTDGILVRFISDTTTPDPETEIRICDLDTEFSKLYFGAGFLFWAPQDNIAFDEAMRLLFIGAGPSPYASLAKISNMNPHSFYLNYSQPEHDCLVIDTGLFIMETMP